MFLKTLSRVTLKFPSPWSNWEENVVDLQQIPRIASWVFQHGSQSQSCSLCGQPLINQSQSWMCNSQGSWCGVWTCQPLGRRIPWSPHLLTASFLLQWSTCRTGRPAKVPKMSKPQAKFMTTKDKLPTMHSS
jgi:hypothetical protein